MCIQKQKWKWALWQLHAFQLWVPLQIILSKEQSATPLHCKSTRSSSDRNTKVTDYFCHCTLYSLTENKAQNYLSALYCPVGKYENNMLGTLIVYLLANYLQVYKKSTKMLSSSAAAMRNCHSGTCTIQLLALKNYISDQ